MLTLRHPPVAARLRDESGQAMVLVAAGMVAFLMMLGLVVDGGNLFQNKQSLQNAADASALAAAVYIADNTKSCVANASDPIGSCAGAYASLNSANGPNGDSATLQCTTAAPNACALPPCNSGVQGLNVSDTQAPTKAPGCYLYPYNGNSALVEVWLTRRTSNFFGKLFGRATSGESARAVASVVTTTTIIPGTITTTGGNPALLFAMCGYGSYTGPACAASGPPDSTCTALSLGGSNQILNGAVVSNGGVQNGGNNDGPGPLYYNKAFGPSPGNGTCFTADAQWLSKIPEAPRDWPVPLPTCTPSCSPDTQSNHLLVTSVTANGVTVPCTPMPVNFDNPTLHGTGALNTVKIDGSPTTLILASHSLYCATTSITLSDTLKLRDVGFVAPAISWAAPSSTLTGYQGFYGVSPTNYGGFLFDAYGSGDPTHGGVSWSSGQDGFTGAIFAPNATATLSGSTSSLKCDVTGLGSSDSCGFVEARTISLGGSGFTWQGTGPTFGAVQQCLINGVPLPGWKPGDPCQQTVTTKSVGGLTG